MIRKDSKRYQTDDPSLQTLIIPQKIPGHSHPNTMDAAAASTRNSRLRKRNTKYADSKDSHVGPNIQP